MGILILFVLTVGAGTIIYFVWKGVVAFWRKADSGELVGNQRGVIDADDNIEFWGRSNGWQYDGSQHNGKQNNGFGRGW